MNKCQNAINNSQFFPCFPLFLKIRHLYDTFVLKLLNYVIFFLLFYIFVCIFVIKNLPIRGGLF